MSANWKRLVIRLTLMLIGIGVIIPLAEDAGPLRWVAFAGFVLALSSGLSAILVLPAILNELSPPAGLRADEEVTAKWIDAALCVGFCGALLVQALETDAIDNTLGGTDLYWISLLGGAVLSVVALVLFSKRYSFVWRDGKRRFGIALSVVLTFGFFTATTVNFMNRVYAAPTTYKLHVQVVRKGESARAKRNRAGAAYYLFIKLEGDVERIVVEEMFWRGVRENQSISLLVRKGLLARPVVVGYQMQEDA